MPYAIRTRTRGADNAAIGDPTGRERLVAQGDYAPVRIPEAPYVGASVSTTITRSSTTATASATAHGLAVGDNCLIQGADQAEYNGVKRVLTVADANTFTFNAYGDPTSPATGTITTQKVAS